MHTIAKINDAFEATVGGEFFHTKEFGNNVLLIAGGVGINPLISIMADLVNNSDEYQINVALLYSCKTENEFQFMDRIKNFEDKLPDQVSSQYFVTQESLRGNDKRFYNRRIDSTLIENAMKRFESTPICYLCGPKSMLDSCENDLTSLLVPKENIKYEKWW